MKKKIVNFSLAGGSLLMMLVVVEFYLRSTHCYDSYSEKSGKKYVSMFNSNNPAPGKCMVTREPNDISVNAMPEFTTVFKTNSLGFSDSEWQIEKSGCRIVCLGDSYTEGLGSTNDSTYPNILQKRFPEVEIMNWGKSGADIVENACLFEREVLQYRPDIAIVGINQSDVVDIILRGGNERFLGVPSPDGPSWEKFYGKFRLVRWVAHRLFGLTVLLSFPDEYRIDEQNAVKEICEAMDLLDDLSKQNGIVCIFVIHPMPWDWGRKNIEECIKHADNCKYQYINGMEFFPQSSSIPGIDQSFYWKIDGHYNNRGYALLADVVEQRLKNYLR